MNISWIGVGSIVGNTKDMLGYMEPLYEEGYDITLHINYSPTNKLSFEEMYDRWDTIIPFNCVNRINSYKDIQDSVNSKKEFLIAAAPSYLGNLKAPACKTIFKYNRLPDIHYFTVSETLSKELDTEYIPRAIDYHPFYTRCRKKREYDITDASVYNNNKNIGILHQLARRYKAYPCLSVQQDWQVNDIQSYFPELIYKKNASRDEVADIMGNSKLLVHPANCEQASVTIDEALCAGCYIIGRDTTSFREQVGEYGSIARDDNDIFELTDKMLNTKINHKKIAKESFRKKDREYVKDIWLNKIEEWLEDF